ncbi:hypothetical protein [Haloarchaeobius iranensis]|uniref:Uncharacterized protein n=1 Tax=Haloarchaeobius iranensis TaxID=996166 RepID=A0A1G9VGS0_9EURY|nr:hypothetical protein [Haloarchaeobius iranensis]SDM71468.1 hypothetical protein SAMN05192554_106111 [Haloarchaeobius iranensis]
MDDGRNGAGTLTASPVFELLLLLLVALPFVVVLADSGTVATGPLTVAAAVGGGWGLLVGPRGDLGFGWVDWRGRIAVLTVLVALLAGTVHLVHPPLSVYASASLGLAGGIAAVRVGRLVAG